MCARQWYHEAVVRITEAILRQLRLNERKNLLHSDPAGLLEIDSSFLAALEQEVGTDSTALSGDRFEEAVSLAAELMIDRLYSTNQYIQVDEPAREALKSIYRRTWAICLETGDVETALRQHHFPLLADWVGRLYPGGMKAALASQKTIGPVVCQTYSAEFQIQLLRLDLQKLRQPLLDIGCGKDALLVRYLRSLDIEAYGLDRSLRRSSPFLEECHWLEKDYEAGKWGTVVSNMAFTNHFAYVHRHDMCQAPRYQEKYREILESLQDGGSFVYGPGAPELEKGAERQGFLVEGWPVGNGHGITRITKAV